jgi:hypothetical protein
MAWGDLFKDKDLDVNGDIERCQNIVKQNMVPGTMVTIGSDLRPFGYVWTEPILTSESHYVRAGVGMIIGVDCLSDPSTDWLMLWLVTRDWQSTCWVPSGVVKVV